MAHCVWRDGILFKVLTSNWGRTNFEQYIGQNVKKLKHKYIRISFSIFVGYDLGYCYSVVQHWNIFIQ